MWHQSKWRSEGIAPIIRDLGTRTMSGHLHAPSGESAKGTPSIRNHAGRRASQDTLRQKTPAPANFMSKIIGTEIRVGHAQRLSKLITTWLETEGKSFAKRSTGKFHEHLFSSS